jgi:hypothetical protein
MPNIHSSAVDDAFSTKVEIIFTKDLYCLVFSRLVGGNYP